MSGKRSVILKWVFIAGITIMINLFLAYLVDALYKAPRYADFCPNRQVNRVIESEAACLAVGGQWNENADFKIPPPERSPSVTPAGYCNPDYTCAKGFEEKTNVYNRNFFLVFVVVGILLLIGSVYLRGAEAIALGLSFGGVLALIIGSLRYWSDMQEAWRVTLLGVALAWLLVIAWKRFRET